ncbi:hypothetical protein ACW2QC_06965 [Virgibacillus sp. FSP13]
MFLFGVCGYRCGQGGSAGEQKHRSESEEHRRESRNIVPRAGTSAGERKHRPENNKKVHPSNWGAPTNINITY